MIKSIRWSSAVISALMLSSWAAAKVPEMISPPDFPEAPQVVVWISTPENRTVDRLPAKAKEFEQAFTHLLKQSPEKLGLPADVILHIDSVQMSPEADGIPAMAFVRLSQTVEGTPVAGTEITFVSQWLPAGSALRISSARLYPELKKLPQKLVDKDVAERKIWEKLSSEITRFDTAYGGPWVRWINGKWRAVQVYGVVPQGVIAAVDGDGTVFTWPGHVAAPAPAEAKTPKH